MARQQAQQSLRGVMALYGGLIEHEGRDVREGHKRFYLQFGYDVLHAQTLGSNDAAALEAKIRAYLNKRNIVELAA